MKFSDTFSGRFLKAADLPTGHRRVTIESIEQEPVGWPAEDKLVAYFKELQKGLILNKTNSDVLKDTFGDDTQLSVGQIVDLLVKNVEFNGKQVRAIRIGLPAAGPRPPASDPSQSEDGSAPHGHTDGDMPY